jgi:hypothetical protein
MASQPTSRTLQPPPALPAMPDVSSTLTNYLNTFSLWCRHGFADKLSISTAQPGVMLMAHDAAPGVTPKVFLLQVNSAGVVSATPMALGSGKP